jgi:hypothetical protein
MEDSLGLQTAGRLAGPDDRTDQVRGRLDAVLTAARIAPNSARIGALLAVIRSTGERPDDDGSIGTPEGAQ